MSFNGKNQYSYNTISKPTWRWVYCCALFQVVTSDLPSCWNRAERRYLSVWTNIFPALIHIYIYLH